MTAISSVGDQAVALDCQLGDNGGMSIFVTKAVWTFALPLGLILGFFIFWVVYGKIEEGDEGVQGGGQEREEKGGRFVPRRERETSNLRHNGLDRRGEGGHGRAKMHEKEASNEEKKESSDTAEEEKVTTHNTNSAPTTLSTRLYVSGLVLALMFHPTLTKTTFSFFKCSKDIAGKQFLDADMDIECWTQPHYTTLYTLALPSLFLYVLGIPAGECSCLLHLPQSSMMFDLLCASPKHLSFRRRPSVPFAPLRALACFALSRSKQRCSCHGPAVG